MTDILSQCAQIVGDKNVITDANDQAPYLDEPRKKFHGKAAAIVLPKTTQEVADILKLANETGTQIVPQGGNTGLVGGQVPDESGKQIVLSLKRLNQIRSVDPEQNSMVLEAGVILQKAQEIAAENDRLFPLSLAAQGTCTIGGNLASNAGGLNVVAYGNARELCLGLEVVMADGRIWDGLNTLRKNNTGYDLKNLFIGSEGTLGIITAAALKLFPAQNSKATAFVAIKEPKQALALLNMAQQFSGNRVTTIELMPRIGIAMTVTYKQTKDPFAEPYPWYVLLEFSSPQMGDGIEQAMLATLEKALENEIALDAVIAQSGQQAVDLWAIRELIPETQKEEGGSIKHDISVPLSSMPQFLREAEKAVLDLIPDARPVPFGHVGDGNIHFNITQPKGADTQEFLARWNEVNEVVHKIAHNMGGSISAEHGIGQLKAPLLPDVKSPLELEMMRNLKTMFDPKNVLNPKKVLL